MDKKEEVCTETCHSVFIQISFMLAHSKDQGQPYIYHHTYQWSIAFQFSAARRLHWITRSISVCKLEWGITTCFGISIVVFAPLISVFLIFHILFISYVAQFSKHSLFKKKKKKFLYMIYHYIQLENLVGGYEKKIIIIHPVIILDKILDRLKVNISCIIHSVYILYES